jgi:hypothetical protein
MNQLVIMYIQWISIATVNPSKDFTFRKTSPKPENPFKPTSFSPKYPRASLAKSQVIPQLTSRPIIIIRLISIRIHPPTRPIQILHPINILLTPPRLILLVLILSFLTLTFLLFLITLILNFILLLRLITIDLSRTATTLIPIALHPLRRVILHLDILALGPGRRCSHRGGGVTFASTAVGIGLLGLALVGFDFGVGFEFLFEARAEGVEF